MFHLLKPSVLKYSRTSVLSSTVEERALVTTRGLVDGANPETPERMEARIMLVENFIVAMILVIILKRECNIGSK